MTKEEAIKGLKENLCSLCAYGSQNMDSCDIKECDNRDFIKVLEQQPGEDYLSREFIKIIVEYPLEDLCTYPKYKGKPYFSIVYRENGEEFVGYGTYKPEVLTDYLKRYFMPTISYDCVSREQAIKTISTDIQLNLEGKSGLLKYSDEIKDILKTLLDNQEKKLKSLPPVTPTQCIAAVRFSKEDLREICNERIEIECTHGICKDCTKSKILNDFEGYSIVCSRFGRMAVNPDFYCADFEKQGNEK